MWAALKYAREHEGAEGQQNLLLMDEPELCLHPNAIREACNTLYDLPSTGKWQVMVTTHSPAFIDLSRDNTTVVRVERDASADIIRGTTVFRPEIAKLSEDDKTELKMLNLCDPNLCEFFFGGRTVIVEGDTEYTAFKFILSKYADDPKLHDVHIVRARGKATICLVAKILNQFGARYGILHDSDSPTCVARKRNGELYNRTNSAWTVNGNICESVEVALSAGRARLIAMIPNFEAAFFEEEVSSEKPVNAWQRLKASDEACETVRDLLYCLLDFECDVPAECEEWDDIAQLTTRWEAYAAV
jgi:putative ATP-dependent endonuclease of OLD family